MIFNNIKDLEEYMRCSYLLKSQFYVTEKENSVFDRNTLITFDCNHFSIDSICVENTVELRLSYEWYKNNDCKFSTEPFAESKFKVGDKVRCTSNDYVNIYKDSIYTIKHINNEGWISLNEPNTGSYKDYAFELVEDNNKNGSIISLTTPKESMFNGQIIYYDKTTQGIYFKNESEVTKMELKEIKKENLLAGKDIVEEQKKKAEIEYAAQEYKRIIDEVDNADRNLKKWQEIKDKYVEELKVFRGK